MPSDELTVQALSLIASGAPAQALRVLGAPRGGQGQGLLRAALRELLLTPGDALVIRIRRVPSLHQRRRERRPAPGDQRGPHLNRTCAPALP
jgi:hypothetical protein